MLFQLLPEIWNIYCSFKTNILIHLIQWFENIRLIGDFCNRVQPSDCSHQCGWGIWCVGEWVSFCVVRCLGYPTTCMWVLWLCVPHGVCASSICYALLGRKFNLCPNLTCHRCLFIRWPAPATSASCSCDARTILRDRLRIQRLIWDWTWVFKEPNVPSCGRVNFRYNQKLLSELKLFGFDWPSLNLWVCSSVWKFTLLIGTRRLQNMPEN